MLSAGELASMRTDATAWLPQTCRVWRLSVVSDNRGGQTQTYALHEDALPCRLAPGSSRTEAEVVIEGRSVTDKQWLVTVPHDAEVLSTDRVEVSGLMLEITSLDRGRADLVSLRLVCREVE
jgi:hypothetical protein